MRNTTERRQLILEFVAERRKSTISELCFKFGISEKTVRRDLLILSCSYPIYTAQGSGGGVFVQRDYVLHKKYLNDEQTALLEKLSKNLIGEDLATMQDILQAFTRPNSVR